MLAAVALLSAAYSPAGAATTDIYTWTDPAGVVHFSDAPPSHADASGLAGEAPLPLDEDTSIPETLNDLAPPAGDVPVAPVAPRRQGDEAAPAEAARRAEDSFAAVGPGTMTPEELDALDPVWFRGSHADPGAATAVYFDAHGPFSIGKPLEDTRAPPELRCRAARRDFEILQESWPVYQDQGGRLRYQWARDPYRGARRYLDDAGRSKALAGVRQVLQRDCATPDDPGARGEARKELLRAALCEAERAELAALEALGSDAPGQTLTEKKALAAEVCGDPPPVEGTVLNQPETGTARP
jgi:hypothetical protein